MEDSSLSNDHFNSPFEKNQTLLLKAVVATTGGAVCAPSCGSSGIQVSTARDGENCN
jgi:thymidine kinase